MAQGVTTSSMTGFITDDKGDALPGATVFAVHTPSGTQYGASTLADGRFVIPSMRVGGPYKVTVTFVGFQDQVFENIYLSLGTAATLNAKLAEQSLELGEIEVTASRNEVFSSDRTGAATNIGAETITSLPTISRSINDFTRLTPQANGRSFSGQDSRFNNISIDGSIFNNSFGLADQPGGRTGQSPISLDAIEEIQVNLAPYDVRQAGFTGAGINAVTRSGTNDFSGSVFYTFRNNDFLGTKARSTEVISANFDTYQAGLRLGGPIIKNKLFFFINGEIERETRPATEFLANRGEPVGGNITRVLASDLDDLSSYLAQNFNYETGPYDGYDFETRSDKFLVKLDYNISNNHRASIRYSYFDSTNDILVSNSSSLGRGNRRSSLNSLNFANSNYGQTESIHSVIAELNSTFGGKMSNNFIIGYTYQNEDRESKGSFFPLVEILDGNVNYTTFGFEPFTPSNKLNYKTFQIQNNFTYYANKHTITAGFNLERLSFENVFFPGSQGVWVFNSLTDWYTAADAYLDNPNIVPGTTVSPVSVNRFQYRFSALPGGAEPVQPTKVTYAGLYIQDEYSVNSKFNVTYGIRVDVPFFGDTGFRNPSVESLNFLNEFGQIYQTRTDKLPDPQLLVSPRVGFNWDVFGNKKTQLRGGSGIFTGRPPFVWISNQIGNNGVLTGFIQQDATTAFPFTPDPSIYAPDDPAANLPTTFELATTDPNFKFPQIWRTNVAVDQQLPFGFIGTVEFIYNKNINAIRYIDSNQEPSVALFPGPDNRPSYPGLGLSGSNQANAIRINDNIANNTVLTNTDEGFSYNLTFQLDRPFDNGLFIRLAYTYGFAKDLLSAGSIANGSFTGIRSVNGNNRPDLTFSNNDQRHRLIAAISYRKEYGNFGATEISTFFSAFNQGRYTYTYAGDYNGDAINNNDLLYIPRDVSELNFLRQGASIGGGNTNQLTPEQQAAAFNAFIESDEYLRERRGQYAERNGAFLPRLTRMDLSVTQEFFVKLGEKRNTIQIRADILNFGNMLNSNWGVSRSIINSTPLAAQGVVTQADIDLGRFTQDRLGQPVVRFQQRNFRRPDGTSVTIPIDVENVRYNTSISDVWQLQLSFRYIFN
ncbi:MAG: carboxypeptidase regulatory-like domain-containing protein [Microscillaceae bacterium]